MENLIGELGAALGADQAERKGKLEALWDSIDPGDHAARCIAAHYIADAQDDLDEELAWDERSLTESAFVSDAQLQAIHPTLSVVGFLPSLHLNLADGYRRLGRFDSARAHLEKSREFDFALDDADPAYAAGIRDAQAGVADKISVEDLS
ncbi:MAG: hypothetical protein QM728_00280 [Gordonia sp. (in: high G+C Gram-positive bacteria)]|uniref:hypothetical protein n=1 Tax=Gordonia sp. (in: high G+C Gram-positive bacteria) TaxID=84139 RepID=UPI0039E58812